MNDVKLGSELTSARREIRELKQELQRTQAELAEWQHNAILLSPAEIYAFTKQERERKRAEREAADQAALMEIDKLMVSVATYRQGVTNDGKNL